MVPAIEWSISLLDTLMLNEAPKLELKVFVCLQGEFQRDHVIEGSAVIHSTRGAHEIL